MVWILNNRGLIFGVIFIVAPLVIAGWFFGTKKHEKCPKNAKNKEPHEAA